MTIDRRGLISAGAGIGVAAGAMALGARASAAQKDTTDRFIPHGSGSTGERFAGIQAQLTDDESLDQTLALQSAIDTAASAKCAVLLPRGRFLIGAVELRNHTTLIGANGHTTLAFAGGASFISGNGVRGVHLEGFHVDGRGLAQELVVLQACRDVTFRDMTLRLSLGNALALTACSGLISNCDISYASWAAIFSLDAVGLRISDNRVHLCSKNGIQVWRSKVGDDGTVVSRNRVSGIAAKDGGSGQNGNGINVYRAGGVMICENQISDCAYSAVRGNAASNIQIIGNSCARIGEVALYAEFGFEGAVISSNVVDTAACGVAVTNFNEGGRLAVVQGNLVRNIFRREHEPHDKRGEGISVEADVSVTGNTIEAAQTVGLSIGWGPYMRDVVASGNVIRSCPIGIGISSDKGSGACVISQNLISSALNGAVRAMDRGRAHGPDLAKSEIKTGRVLITGNLGV